MPLRKLGNLANLNRHGQNALPNTARCTDRKRTAQTGTENHVPTASSRQRKRKKLKKTRSPSPNASNSDVSGHSTASRQSLPRRVLASIVNLVSPSRPSRRSSPTCSVSSEDFSHLEAPFSHFDTPNDTPVNDNPPSTSAADFETDPAAIDIPQGEGEAYAAAPLDPEEDDQDDLEEEERAIPGGPGISWDHRKPPTEVMALEALEAIQLLLYVPPAEGKRKRKIPTKINGWSRQHLTDISTFLNLYTGKGSNTRGQWMESSVQATAAIKGRASTPYGAARTLRERARKYVLAREVPVNKFGTWAKSQGYLGF